MKIPHNDKPRLVIIGGGFAGLHLARHLKKADLQIVLLDRQNFHTFQPLLYQVASAMLEPDSVASSFRKIFQRRKNLHFRMVEVDGIDPETKTVHTSGGLLDYDILVLATGAYTNFYGMEDIAAHGFSMKNVTEAVAIRQKILKNFEKALMLDDRQEQERLMNIIIVGGGATGVEIAGALAELKNYILPHDYPELDIQRMHISMIEATDRLLAGMSDEAHRLARRTLDDFGVDLYFNSRVVSYDGETATLNDGRTIASSLLIWVAGIACILPAGLDKVRIIANGRIKVDAFNRVEGYDDIYAIGDVACMPSDQWPAGHPMLAPVAIQQAKALAGNLIAPENGKKPFSYKNPGVMATIGRNHAVVERGNFSFDGFAAWVTWLFVHLMTLVGFRHKVIAFLNWAWNYFTYDRAMRLIIPWFERKK